MYLFSESLQCYFTQFLSCDKKKKKRKKNIKTKQTGKITA